MLEKTKKSIQNKKERKEGRKEEKIQKKKLTGNQKRKPKPWLLKKISKADETLQRPRKKRKGTNDWYQKQNGHNYTFHKHLMNGHEYLEQVFVNTPNNPRTTFQTSHKERRNGPFKDSHYLWNTLYQQLITFPIRNKPTKVHWWISSKDLSVKLH